jgi:probable rRNA maturation factor
LNLAIGIDDPAWSAVAGLEGLAARAISAALKDTDVEISLLFTSDEEIARLNAKWRGKATPTNVLSFPAPEDLPVPDGEPKPLGDIVLAAGVVAREAEEQGKTLADHTLHLLVHGMLHLLGHDHVKDAAAEEMEDMERKILASLGVADPYGGGAP